MTSSWHHPCETLPGLAKIRRVAPSRHCEDAEVNGQWICHALLRVDPPIVGRGNSLKYQGHMRFEAE